MWSVSYKKTDESDYKWLRVTTSDWVTSSDYEWLQVTTSDYESDYEGLRVRLRVTTSDYKWLPETTSQERNTPGSRKISYNCRQETSSNR